MITIHHLGRSASERIVWLCEELGLPYQLQRYTREPGTDLSPPQLRALHPLGASPVIEDGDLLLAESAAIVEYLIVKYGQGRFKPGLEHPDYTHFLYWFHFSNGNLQPAVARMVMIGRANLASDHPVQAALQHRLDRIIALIDARLGVASYLAGSEFTAADLMTVFSLTTMRLFRPIDLTPHANIRAYLQRIGERRGYRDAMANSDPDLTPLLS